MKNSIYFLFLDIVFHWSIPSKSSFKDGFPLKPRKYILNENYNLLSTIETSIKSRIMLWDNAQS